MKRGGGSLKGGEFERLICRRLTWWHTKKERPEIFWRSASSGAKATQNMKAGIDAIQIGDIIAIDERGQWFIDAFHIECKDRKDFRIELCIEKRGDLWNWWKQCSNDAQAADKCPMLIFKRLRSPIYLAYQQEELPLKPSGHPASFTDTFDQVIIVTRFEDWIRKFKIETVQRWFRNSDD